MAERLLQHLSEVLFHTVLYALITDPPRKPLDGMIRMAADLVEPRIGSMSLQETVLTGKVCPTVMCVQHI